MNWAAVKKGDTGEKGDEFSQNFKTDQPGSLCLG